MSSLVTRRTANSYIILASNARDLNAKFEADLTRSRGRAREVCYEIPKVFHSGKEFITLSNRGEEWFLGTDCDNKFALATASLPPFALALIYDSLAAELCPSARPKSDQDDGGEAVAETPVAPVAVEPEEPAPKEPAAPAPALVSPSPESIAKDTPIEVKTATAKPAVQERPKVADTPPTPVRGAKKGAESEGELSMD